MRFVDTNNPCIDKPPSHIPFKYLPQMKMLLLCELKPSKTQLTQNQNVVFKTSVP